MALHNCEPNSKVHAQRNAKETENDTGKWKTTFHSGRKPLGNGMADLVTGLDKDPGWHP